MAYFFTRLVCTKLISLQKPKNEEKQFEYQAIIR
jgi:hypothetical protein